MFGAASAGASLTRHRPSTTGRFLRFRSETSSNFLVRGKIDRTASQSKSSSHASATGARSACFASTNAINAFMAHAFVAGSAIPGLSASAINQTPGRFSVHASAPQSRAPGHVRGLCESLTLRPPFATTKSPPPTITRAIIVRVTLLRRFSSGFCGRGAACASLCAATSVCAWRVL